MHMQDTGGIRRGALLHVRSHCSQPGGGGLDGNLIRIDIREGEGRAGTLRLDRTLTSLHLDCECVGWEDEGGNGGEKDEGEEGWRGGKGDTAEIFDFRES
jgi:hypothetical protein